MDWAGDGVPEWTRQDWVHDWCDDEESVTLTLARWDSDFRLDFPDLCEFILQPRLGAILVRPRCELDAATIEHLLVDQVLPRYLAHEGRLLVHASAVTSSNGCVLFLGKSGWGKSTLAGLLDRLGHGLLSDDCVIVDTEPGQVVAMATYPSLRLNRDSLAQAFNNAPASKEVATYTSKRRLALPPRPLKSAAHVEAIYLINDPAHSPASCDIRPLNAADLCMALIHHSFQLDITDTERTRQQLEKASLVARSVPAYALGYPRDFAQASAVASIVSRHVGLLPRQPSEY